MKPEQNYQIALELLSDVVGQSRAIELLQELKERGVDVERCGYSSNIAYSECNNCGERDDGY